jgi:Mrp family chromosome partitioning ATPase
MPQNPTELLGSMTLKRWVEVFRRDLDVDVVLFDSPPCLVVADSVVLSSAVGTQTVLVIQANSTRRTEALKAKERFTAVDLEIVGTVLNAANPRDEEYYGYGYYSYYYDADRLPTQQEIERN